MTSDRKALRKHSKGYFNWRTIALVLLLILVLFSIVMLAVDILSDLTNHAIPN